MPFGFTLSIAKSAPCDAEPPAKSSQYRWWACQEHRPAHELSFWQRTDNSRFGRNQLTDFRCRNKLLWRWSLRSRIGSWQLGQHGTGTTVARAALIPAWLLIECAPDSGEM